MEAFRVYQMGVVDPKADITLFHREVTDQALGDRKVKATLCIVSIHQVYVVVTMQTSLVTRLIIHKVTEGVLCQGTLGKVRRDMGRHPRQRKPQILATLLTDHRQENQSIEFKPSIKT